MDNKGFMMKRAQTMDFAAAKPQIKRLNTARRRNLNQHQFDLQFLEAMMSMMDLSNNSNSTKDLFAFLTIDGDAQQQAVNTQEDSDDEESEGDQ